MAIKKSELYSSLWSSCDELRGGMDASQYKDYVLVLLFVKYVSDKYAGRDDALISIPEGASFADMVALKGKPDIGDQINKRILGPLAQENRLSDMPDFNDATKLGSGKEMVDRLTNLIAIFENPALDFSKNRADGDDILGDAYEYLMRHFATESGKSKGQFYTPAEVSRIMARILRIRHASVTSNTTVYDPTCGSGSLLLKVGDEASYGRDVKVTLYGQEKDSATSGLAYMNMVLHNHAEAEIKQGNTLANPLFKDGDALKTFDYVVANPPFSDKRWSTGLDPDNDAFHRFDPYGVPPAKQGDYAYLLHIVRSLKSTGKGACILPHGVLFRGNAEAVIRKNLLTRGLIKAVIGLPANLFYGTGIPACIIVLDKEDAASRKGVFLIDASKGFIKDGNKNRLREQDIHKIVDTFARQADFPRYSRMVPLAEISDPKNDFNLNLPRYIDSTEPEDLQDIEAHLHGGIPNRDIDALAEYWTVLPSVRASLFAPLREGYSALRVEAGEVKTAIFGHPEFTAFNASVMQTFSGWLAQWLPELKALSAECRPKALIESLSESLLEAFGKVHLLDPYDVYQHLLDQWGEFMQDDVYLIVADGWRAAAQPQLLVEEKGKKSKDKPDFSVGKRKYKTELLPSSLLVARYFAKEQAEIERLEADAAAVGQTLEELVEEHCGEDGLLEDAKDEEKDKLTKASASARLKKIKSDPEAAEERKVLTEYLALCERETELGAQAKSGQEDLMEKVLAQDGMLTDEDIRTLVVEDKWLASLSAAVQGELDRVSQTLTGRIRVLAERYAKRLPELESDVEALAAKVEAHLGKMGFKR